ncbi:junctional adhesion molecule A-like isoform X5 [Cyprinus carpio]|uniref:Junctional adhesion molecule A-like isoform X5 n=1 Tax=Cyprinus carpio TaxID=7962 RepID=A0A9R0A4I8_CYPCA|nr:junctional adhesion molecule A-like isoform X5 [Cyprinus carpio]
MADKRHMCLLGLIILCALLTGISGVDDNQVFCSSGEDVRLSCNNALSGCTSTTWNYSNHSETVELIAGGIKTDTERHERLSLGSDCSLNIKKVTKEDYGSYSCRQYVNGQQQDPDARVYLHVLHVSSSSSQSEIRSGSSVTLFCQLYYDYYLVSCVSSVGSEGLEVIWVNQAGVNLQTDSRFQISFSSEQCLSSLTTTLLNEDHNREWRCQVKHRDQLKTSATYTVKYQTPTETKTPSPVTISKSPAAPTQPASVDSTLIPVSSSNSEKKSSQTTAAASTKQVSLSVIWIAVAAALAVLITAVILWVIRRKRADKREGTNDSVEQKDDVTYTEVVTHCKIRAKKNKVHDDDKVTYSSIRGATVRPQDDCSQLYASVNKNHHK